MRRLLCPTLAIVALAACNDDSLRSSANPTAPDISLFSAAPTMVLAGTATNVTWSWAFAQAPFPEPTCSIDNGVGAVESGDISAVVLPSDTIYTLTCTNEAGSDTAELTVTAVSAAVAPELATFTASPSSLLTGTATSVTWSWTYANSPTPTPDCSINAGVGPLDSGDATSVTLATDTTFTLTCSNIAGSDTLQLTLVTSAVPVAPDLTAFDATPASLIAGVATDVTWSWSYLGVPVPSPTCSIDQGVGPVQSGNSTSVTLSANTTFTLTCSNSAGSDTLQLAMPVQQLLAPTLTGFTATPSSVVTGVATDVIWAWTFSAPPVPAADCSIDQGVGTVANGGATSVTLSANTTFTLTCSNSEGSDTALVTVNTVSSATPPDLNGFTVTPSTVEAYVPYDLTWTWSYANSPSPVPDCSINQGIGAVTNGGTSRVTLTTSTTYTLTCTNAGGSDNFQDTVTVTVPAFVQVSAGAAHSCARTSTGRVACWGSPADGRTSPPVGTFSAMDAGDDYACAKKSDNTVSCWGHVGSDPQFPPAATTFNDFSSGEDFTCGVKTDNTIQCWGWDFYGQVSGKPAGAFDSVSAGTEFGCAIKSSDKSLACWGRNQYNQATPPAGAFKVVSTGFFHACAIKTDDTLACWGNNTFNQVSSKPSGAVLALSTAGSFNCAIKSDKTLACWGHNAESQVSNKPAGTFTAVGCGYFHCCAVKESDGTLDCWGLDGDGQATPP